MKLTGLKNVDGKGVLYFLGCQLRRGYCTHNRQPFKEHSVEGVVAFLRNPAIRGIYLGGAAVGDAAQRTGGARPA